MSSHLFRPLSLRSLTLRNRLVLSPMCQYAAEEGLANDWHFAHLAQFAIGGTGLVFTEAAAVCPEGRITHGDLGIWSEAHAQALQRVAGFLKAQGAVPGIQLGHAGRKASMQRPWFGNGPLAEADFERGDHPWEIVAPSAVPVAPGWLVPHELSLAALDELVQTFAAGAAHALAAGFEVAEIHGAHGYLLHSFLSPLANQRTDAYGGSRANRMRLALEVTEAVRAVWPEHLPLFFRVSAVDGLDGGWTLEDSVVLARELKARGVDVIDCSSRGIAGAATASQQAPQRGFQVSFAQAIREEAAVATQAVGLIVTAQQAEAVIRSGQADLVALAREALYQPSWPRQAQQQLEGDQFAEWPPQYGWWLERRRYARGNPEDTLNEQGQPIGFPLEGWQPPPLPGRQTLEGRFCRVEPLDLDQHAAELYEAYAQDAQATTWTYLPYGPFASADDYFSWLQSVSASTDPMFWAIVSQASGKALGVASYLRINPTAGSVEVGHVSFAPALQRTPIATEAMYLMMEQVFALGYRRYEWKCDALNVRSCQAAQRFGFSFEGLFRQALTYKGRNRDTAWFALTDRDWPLVQQAFQQWLAPDHLGEAGVQTHSLSSLTRPLLHRVLPPHWV